MSLMTDARVCTNNANLAKDKIKIDILEEIEQDLEDCEKISILFLITPSEFLPKSYDKIIDSLKNKKKLFREWIENFKIQDWEEKLLESLLIIKNINVVNKIGFTLEEQVLFHNLLSIDQPQVTPNLNRVLKALYYLCDDLNIEETKTLINEFVRNNEELETNELELGLLYFMKKGYILISGILYYINV